MSSDPTPDVAPPIISITGLGKEYALGASLGGERYTALRDVIANRARALFKRPARVAGPAREASFWALDEVSFDIQPGEVVGIIGRNGAGKSTLLKVLSRITEPTRGKIELRGRVASLLEVGTGFHPELTGRENIYLNGAILGMARSEINAKFDEIVAFAEVERFLDTPVKRYSSGMYVRLAFAVAAHLEPEILVVDEVLAVGDAEFQKKCLGKMQDVSRGGGRTVLLVSHNMGHLLSICTRVVWLKGGKVVMSGEPNAIVGRYLSEGAETSGAYRFPDRPSAHPCRFTHFELRDADGATSSALDVRAPFTLNISYRTEADISGFELTVRVLNTNGVAVFSSNRSQFLGEMVGTGDFTASFEVPAEFLMPGDYIVTVGSFRLGGEVYEVHEGFVSFTVEETGSSMARYQANASQVGVVLVHFPWTEERNA